MSKGLKVGFLLLVMGGVSQGSLADDEIRPAPESLNIKKVVTTIEPQCTMNGGGEVVCAFKNAGKKKGSVCVRPVIYFKPGTFGNYYLGKRASDIGTEREDEVLRSIYLSQTEICSGIINPRDARQVTGAAAFFKAPYELCASPKESWTSNCLIEFLPTSR